MARIEWNDALSVQNDELDSQHKELLRLYNLLHEALVNGSPEETIETKQLILDALVVYTLQHFTTEEKYLEEIQFPERHEHCLQHQGFSEKILQLNREVKANTMVLTTSLIKILRNWITEHLDEKDQEYAKFASIAKLQRHVKP